MDAESLSEKWDREERAERIAKAKVMAAWVVGWSVRQFCLGVLIGMGIWVGFTVIGAKIVCQ